MRPANRPFPSSKKSHFQNETFVVKMSFICMIIKIHFHISGFTLSLALKVIFFGTRKWPMYSAVLSSTLSTYVFQLQIFHFHWSIPSGTFFFILNVYTDFLLKIHEISQFLSTCPKSATTTNAAQRTTNLIQRWLENRFSSKIAASIPLSASKSGSKDQDNIFLCQLMSVKNPFKECKVKSPQLYFCQQPHKTLLTSGDPQYVKLSFTEIPPNLTVNGEYK